MQCMDSYFSLFLSIWGFNSSQNSGVSLSNHLALSLGHFIPCWRNSFREPSALFQSWGAIFDQKTAKVGTGVPQESQQPPPLPDWETYVLPTVSSKKMRQGFWNLCLVLFDAAGFLSVSSWQDLYVALSREDAYPSFPSSSHSSAFVARVCLCLQSR